MPHNFSFFTTLKTPYVISTKQIIIQKIVFSNFHTLQEKHHRFFLFFFGFVLQIYTEHTHYTQLSVFKGSSNTEPNKMYRQSGRNEVHAIYTLHSTKFPYTLIYHGIVARFPLICLVYMLKSIIRNIEIFQFARKLAWRKHCFLCIVCALLWLCVHADFLSHRCFCRLLFTFCTNTHIDFVKMSLWFCCPFLWNFFQPHGTRKFVCNFAWVYRTKCFPGVMLNTIIAGKFWFRCQFYGFIYAGLRTMQYTILTRVNHGKNDPFSMGRTHWNARKPKWQNEEDFSSCFVDERTIDCVYASSLVIVVSGAETRWYGFGVWCCVWIHGKENNWAYTNTHIWIQIL